MKNKGRLRRKPSGNPPRGLMVSGWPRRKRGGGGGGGGRLKSSEGEPQKRVVEILQKERQ